MSRPVSISDEAIIEAARAVFLEHGFKATTAEVARRANVSEGSIFKRYPSKFELFRASMESQVREPTWVRSLHERVGHGDLKENLVALGADVVAFFREVTPLMMMCWSNPGPDGVPSMPGNALPPPVRAAQEIACYFEGEMRLDRMRRVEPMLAARAFLGGLLQLCFTELVLRATRGNHEGPPTHHVGEHAAYVRDHVSLLWEGLAPSPRDR